MILFLFLDLGASYTGVSFVKIYGDGQLYMQIFVCICYFLILLNVLTF